MKPKRAFTLFGLLKNDLEFVDTQTLRQKIYEQSRFSILYFILLIGSVLVCTLGLLTNNSSIVIGGMLIAPLMWPLARLGYGIAHSSPRHLTRGWVLLMASILIGAISAYLITSISPIKVINSEILARTSPTLMDLFIALTAGFVAAIAITQKKIADSLAGVAIAVSLMPPLCTVGIALSLNNIQFSLGALLLFAVNAACITFVTTLVLAYNHYVRTRKFTIARRAISINLVLILLMAVPLVQFLRTYSFEVQSYGAVTSEMENFIAQKDAGASFESIEVSNTDNGGLLVNADLLLPSDKSFTYEDSEALISILEGRTERKVALNLRIQNVIEPVSKNQKDNEQKIKDIRAEFSTRLSEIESGLKVSAITIQRNESKTGWDINADVLTSPDNAPTSAQVDQVAEFLKESFNEDIDLNLTFIPRITLRTSQQTVSEEAKKLVESSVAAVDSTATVTSFTLLESDGNVQVSFIITAQASNSFNTAYLQGLKQQLTAQIGQEVSIEARVIAADTISL